MPPVTPPLRSKEGNNPPSDTFYKYMYDGSLKGNFINVMV